MLGVLLYELCERTYPSRARPATTLIRSSSLIKVVELALKQNVGQVTIGFKYQRKKPCVHTQLFRVGNTSYSSSIIFCLFEMLACCSSCRRLKEWCRERVLVLGFQHGACQKCLHVAGLAESQVDAQYLYAVPIDTKNGWFLMCMQDRVSRQPSDLVKSCGPWSGGVRREFS